MKIKNKRKIFVIIAILAILSIPFVYFIGIINKPLKVDKIVNVSVEKGDTFYSLLDKFSRDNIIKDKNIIKLYAKATNKNLHIKPGQYQFKSDMSLNDIIKVLTTESTAGVVKVTIPEGFNIDDITNKLDAEGICSKDEFIKAVKEYPLPDFVNKNDGKRYNLEGYLFPDTYTINDNQSASEIVGIMITRFKEMWNRALQETNTSVKDDDIENIITMASMIEKEARVDKERPMISSVIYNRLKINMQLKIDATVIYALGHHVDKVLNKHLAIQSPYNTYQNYGLPIGPICNPGLPSIEAALKPDKTDYLFYVLQKDNTHYFTNSDADFMNKLKELGYQE